MKLLIAYDGSECGDAALNDLSRTGLPETVEALVMTVADVFLPTPVDNEIDDTLPAYLPENVKRAHAQATRAIKDAGILAQTAATRLGTRFPKWRIRAHASADSPAWGIILKASQIDADLVVVGSHGHSDLGGRLILGSVSQRILYEAPCSVRVARSNRTGRIADSGPVRIVLGIDGSSDSTSAIAAVAARTWPDGSEVQLVSVLDTVISIPPSESEPEVVKWVEADNQNDVAWVAELIEATGARLRAAGLKTSTVIKQGNPKHVLVAVAEAWGADCIFVGAKGVRGIERFLLGSVSAAVAARAHCSVDVVRAKTLDTGQTANSPA